MCSFKVTSQSYNDYKKILKKNKDFYSLQIDIWMRAYSDDISIESWEIKEIRYSISPEEGLFFCLKEELSELSSFQKDSINFKLWNSCIYRVDLPAEQKNGDEVVLDFWLNPNGEFHISNEYRRFVSEKPPIYYRKNN
ncbi:hypothetical protein [Parvicella tangerina]|uniref:Uncharacterized protein n=1 Tax=Parvicella tangerina TaxID=2829795 RepID=A0A916NJH1_9FLAO|nr:hypothetical protein [Parvicella tangerina]CAG5086794.1 hypothetical protein CRYO30217_03282 [Parvicella tangerina]